MTYLEILSFKMTDKDSAASEPLASPGGFKRSFDVAFLTGSTEDEKPNNTTGTYNLQYIRGRIYGNFGAFLPSSPSDRKMTLLVNNVTSMLLILTPVCYFRPSPLMAIVLKEIATWPGN